MYINNMVIVSLFVGERGLKLINVGVKILVAFFIFAIKNQGNGERKTAE
jgi:hypothetical protein